MAQSDNDSDVNGSNLFLLNNEIYDEDNLIECLDEESANEEDTNVEIEELADTNSTTDKHLDNKIKLSDGSVIIWKFVDDQGLERKPTNNSDAEVTKGEMIENKVNSNENFNEVVLNGHKYYPCTFEECEKRFKTIPQLKCHMKVHSAEKLFTCNECGKQFRYMYSLNLHTRVHSSEQPYPCTWAGCSKRFKTQHNQLKHTRQHTSDHRYKCRFLGCSKEFTTDSNLKQHSLTTHINEQNQTEIKANSNATSNVVLLNGHKHYPCTFEGCGKFFKTMTKLNYHMIVHSDDKLFKCNECGKKFTRMYSLTLHIRVHSGERPYPCDWDGCCKRFKSASDQRKHARTHTGDRRYECRFQGCHKKFTTACNLKQHTVTHTGERNFVCSICNKSYLHLFHLKNHERIHRKEKPFKCEICSKTFTEYSTAFKHRRTHESSNLTCIICQMTNFKNDRDLQAHVKQIHPEHESGIEQQDNLEVNNIQFIEIIE